VPFLLALEVNAAPAWAAFLVFAAGCYGLTEALMDGQTVGKKMAGLRLHDVSGEQVSGRQAFVRTLLRAIDFLPVLYVVGLLSLLVTRGDGDSATASRGRKW
jgi:uncharacterized RDD family membrane protein YckC